MIILKYAIAYCYMNKFVFFTFKCLNEFPNKTYPRFWKEKGKNIEFGTISGKMSKCFHRFQLSEKAISDLVCIVLFYCVRNSNGIINVQEK